MSTSRRMCARRIVTVCLGTTLIAAGIYMYLNWIEIFTQLRGKEMALSPTSPSFAGWKSSPIPLDFDVYLFNWTNPEEFYTGSTQKPRFEQLGPYRFREIPDKVDIVWHPENSTVSFRKKSVFYFDEARSNGTLQDRVTSVNTVGHSAALRSKNGNIFEKYGMELLLKANDDEVTTTKSAEEWIFAGYVHNLVSLGKMASAVTGIKVPYNRIGWLYPRNDSAEYDGHYNMYTGADDISKMGQVHTWNNLTHNGAFEGECGRVTGSMGEFFPQNLSTNDTISIYLPHLCRAIPMDYVETVKIHGVTAFKFAAGRRAVDNGTEYPEAKCYCVNGHCEASGIINISACKFNSSSYTSFPHFYHADPVYLDAIDGLSPDPEKHEFYMTLEPNSGLVMDVGGGFQANYLMEPVPGIAPFDHIPRAFIPLMWAEERVRVTPEIAADIALVPMIVLVGQIITSILLAAGLILLCWYPTKLVTKMCHDPKTKSNLLSNKLIISSPSVTTSSSLHSGTNSNATTVCQSISSSSSLLGRAASTAHQQPMLIENVPLLEQKLFSDATVGGALRLLGDSRTTSTDVISR